MKKRDRTKDGNGFDHWGGYMAAKKGKLEEQFEHDAEIAGERGGLFQGIAIFVNGYTIPSSEELKALMLLHGGIYHHYESHRTTHIIASNLPHTKLKKLKPGDKIIKPEWIIDSIEKGKLLDYKKYLLYNDQSNSTEPIVKLFFKPNYKDTEKDITVGPNNSDQIVRIGHASNSINENVNVPFTISLETELDSIAKKKNECQIENIRKEKDENSLNDRFQSYNKCDTVEEMSKFNHEVVRSNDGSDNSSEINEDLIMKNSKNENRDSTKMNYFNLSSTKSASSKTASDTKFLGEFYNNSRLHHLSTMGSMFKQYVTELRQKHNGTFDGIEQLLHWKKSISFIDEYEEHTMSQPVIMHIDMDCFFVSVGLRAHPELRDQPVAVAHGKGNKTMSREGVDRQAEFDIYRQRSMNKMGINSENHVKFDKVNSITEFDSMSEISSCNYKAREFGLKNGMFIGQALKQCPGLKIVPYDFERYKEVSFCLYNCITNLTLEVEAVSCDEMYVDCTKLLKCVGLTPLQFATYLRQKILDETKCSCSTGFGSNKLQARLATKKAKPNGQFYLTPELLTEFIETISLYDLPGVGYSIVHKLNLLGANTCGDLQKISLQTLQNELGNKNGLTLYKHCRGEDDRDLNFEHQRKTVSAEVNYGIRFQNLTEMEVFLRQLSGEVEKRLDLVKMKGKSITLKLMVRSAEAPREASKFLGHGVCDYITKSSSLPVCISRETQIFKEVMFIYQKLHIDPKELRGIGIQMSKLELQSKTLPTIDTFFKIMSSSKPSYNKPSTSNTELDVQHTEDYKKREDLSSQNNLNLITDVSSPKKFIFVPDENIKSPNRKYIQSPSKKSPKKLGGMDKYIRQTQKEVLGIPKDFDKSVFDSLPYNIKQEVLRNTKEQLSLLKPKKDVESSGPVNVDASFLNALPDDVREEVLQDISGYKIDNITQNKIKEKTVESCDISLNPSAIDCTQSLLLGPNVRIEEIRIMLREWLQEAEPQSCDIELFTDYLNRLVHNRELDKIIIITRFLQRHTHNKNCIFWDLAYKNILEKIQDTMKLLYGSTLKIG